MNFELIIRGRQEGKTTKLIELSARKGGYIVCRDRTMAGTICRMAEEKNLKIPFPITYHEFIHKQYYGQNIRAFYIDDLEALIAYLGNSVPVKAVTISNNDPDGPYMEKKDANS